MNNQELEVLAGMLSKLAYEMSYQEGISEDLREMCLIFWRRFNHYEEGDQ